MKAVNALYAGDGGGGWAKDADLFKGSALEPLPENGRPAGGFFELRALDDDVSQDGVGRVMHPAAVLKFLGGKSGVVVSGGELNGIVVGVIGLDEHFAGEVSATGSAGDLGEELKGAFGGAEVGQAKRKVCTDHADEGDAVNIVAFGDHLGADEEVDFTGMEAGKKALHVHASTNRVAIHSPDASVGKEFLEALFTLLRARAKVIEVLALAGWAGLGDIASEAAVVALEALARLRNARVIVQVFMECH